MTVQEELDLVSAGFAAISQIVQTVEGAISAMRASLAANDAAADKALDAKFDTGDKP